MTTQLLLILAALVGYLAAAAALGLWIGERGRRKDLAWYTELSRERGTVRIEDSDDPMIRAAERAQMFDRDLLVEDLVKRGLKPKEAEAEADRLINQVHQPAPSTW